MKISGKDVKGAKGLLAAAAFGFLIVSIFLGIIVYSPGVSSTTNETVRTLVNVTNTEPRIYSVTVTPDPVNLNPGGIREVVCNASVWDYNGWQDVTNTSATFYIDSYGSSFAYADADNNYRYVNRSCEPCTQISAMNASCICRFWLHYYALNSSSWLCNMTVADDWGINSSLLSPNATVNPVIGIDVGDVIDFGNLSVTETSSAIRENVTNMGNLIINVSVEGWGGDNRTTGSNLSMVCRDPYSINISNIYERYSLNDNPTFSAMYNITNETTLIPDLTIPNRWNDTHYGNSTNATFWRLYVPLGVAAECNGTVVFSASDATPQ